MLRQQLAETLESALKAKSEQLNIPTENGVLGMLNIERPKMAEHGDYAVNVSPLARHAKMAPPQIAGLVVEGLGASVFEPSIIGGFINFRITDAALVQSLIHRLTEAEPGRNDKLTEMTCLLEFVSANPTGPLHIGHGRWVALGDSLSRIFKHCGATVSKEFYINDAGTQMFNMANSLWYRSLELLGTGGKMPEPKPDEKYPFYPGEYVITLAQEFLNTYKAEVLAWDNPEHVAPPEAITALTAYAKVAMLNEQRALMERCGLVFDEWFPESALHEEGKVQATIEHLKANGFTYEKEGALWFASSRFGDDQDRVLIKSDGKYTYLTADIAYHENKYQRENGKFNRFINIWGADHHGYIPRMKAAVEALGYNPEQLEIILGQLVNLLIEGERTRMGKRRKMLTLEDLVEEVGVDAVRFWMVSKSQDTALDFNVELAASKTDENPVFYAQYAHARCSSILRNAFQPRLDTLSKEELPPLLDEAQWQTFLTNLTPATLASLFDDLENEQARTALKELILKLDSFEDRILDAARNRAPHIVARYILDLAADFHRFYTFCRVLVPEPQKAMQRLVIIHTLKRVLAQALDLLGVSAPEKM